ncbi:hypothetical protein RRG08_043389 [Elysia crispata]|uniref:Uncharacterized protein n=1 Tax=Elysia crispata TaxID=231223 RepID=A0AAE1E4B7_9GAST|nr:hypothetical protein RRG08_043389 [Elysia crispata]
MFRLRDGPDCSPRSAQVPGLLNVSFTETSCPSLLLHFCSTLVGCHRDPPMPVTSLSRLEQHPPTACHGVAIVTGQLSSAYVDQKVGGEIDDVASQTLRRSHSVCTNILHVQLPQKASLAYGGVHVWR